MTKADRVLLVYEIKLMRSFILGFLILAFFTITSWSQNAPVSDLTRIRVTVEMERQPLGIIFRELMEKYDLAIGFEQSLIDIDHSDYDFDTNVPSSAKKDSVSEGGKIRLTVRASNTFKGKTRLFDLSCRDASIETVMNIIVVQMKYYSWAIEDDVINIFPNRGRNERFRDLLTTRVSKFRVEKGRPVRSITDSIMALPEFQTFLADNGLYFSGLRGGSEILIKAQYGRPIPSELNFSNLTFKELLNRAAKIKRGGWILRSVRKSVGGRSQFDLDI